MPASEVKLSTDHVLKGLDDLRNQKLLCDVQLVAEGATFQAHRVVLAAASPYFQAMFTGGFKENQMNEITLNDTSSAGLKCVLDAIYTAELSLSEENVCDVLQVASLLQLNQIIKHCEIFLSRNISRQTCLSFLLAAEKYDLQKAVNTCNEFVLNHFDIISQMVEFKNLSREKLCNYISGDFLKTQNGEIDVFRATLKWYTGNQNGEDSCDLTDLVQHVRFPLIPTRFLVNEVHTNDLISKNAEVMKMVAEALEFQSNDNLFSQPLKEGKQFQPRGEDMLALIHSTFRTEGESITNVETKLHMINDMDDKPFQNHFSEQALSVALRPGSLSMVTKGSYLFVFGVDAKYHRPVAMRFDVRKNTWLDLKPPPRRAAVRMAVALLKGNIFLLGGAYLVKDEKNGIILTNLSACVSQYSIETNSWSTPKNLTRPLAFHSAASHGNYVFCAGGYTRDVEFTDNLHAFDIVGKIWLSRASMNKGRRKFSLEATGAKLVACGGEEVSSVEMYDIADDQWTLIQNEVLENHYDPATVVLNNKVYVIGGIVTGADGTISSTDCVSCVDVNNSTIRKVSSLPMRVSGHGCALLTVPNAANGEDRSQNNN